MKGHPSGKVRGIPYGEALEIALRGEPALVEYPNVETLGMRQRETETRAGKRVYSLEGFVWHDPAAPEKRERFYVLSGGASAARTLLSATGEPTLHAERGRGRGLSPEFRAWVAVAVEADSAFVRGPSSESGSA